jgi:hypothetical protein
MTYTRRKLGRIVITSTSSRQNTTAHAVVSTSPDVTATVIKYGVALAAVHATTGDALAKAKRTRRDAKRRLTALVGERAVAQFTASIELDGGLLLRALNDAPEGMREYALCAALDGAQTALEHGITSRAALVMLARATVWSALAQTYQHASLKAGGDEALDKRAAMAGQQARLDLLGALELAKSTLLAPVMEREVDTQALYAAALHAAEKQSIEAGIISSDSNEMGEGGLSPLSDDENG